MGEKLDRYNIDNCKQYYCILGGNDANSGKALDSFSDIYFSLSNDLSADNHQIIVLALAPNESIEDLNTKIEHC